MELPYKYMVCYDETEGLMVWNSELGRELKQSINQGYARLTINSDSKMTVQLVHRLTARLFIPNPEKKECVDHVDGNKMNNRIDNLRWVSKAENIHNQKKAKGYHWHVRRNKWQAAISIDRIAKHLGYFDQESEARDAYESASRLYYPDIKSELS